MNKTLTILIVSLVVAQSVFSQVEMELIHKKHVLVLKTQYHQIKDEFNYGLVFNGANLGMEYSFTIDKPENTISYKAESGFGPGYDKGIGLLWKLKPADLYYGFKFLNKPVVLGPYIANQYNWQLYPELQSGHMFWFSAIEAGARIAVTIRVNSHSIKLLYSNSMYGFTSRPTPATEEYYYSLRLSDFIQNAHSNMRFGSFNHFGHSILELELLNSSKRLTFAYELDFFEYSLEPTLKFISHSINLKFKIGKHETL